MKRKTLKFAATMLGAALLTAGLAVSKPDSAEAATYAKTVNVTSYGASGSDSAADSVAIQDALNEAIKTNGTLLVKVPAGTYYIDSCLAIYSDTTLQLDPNAKFVRKKFGTAMINGAHINPSTGKYCPQAGCTHGAYTQLNNVTITGGTWDGNAKGNESKMYSGMFYFCHGQNLTISNTTLTNNSGMHMIVMDAMKNVNISGSTFSNAVFYTGTEAKGAYYTTSSLNVAGMKDAQKREQAAGKEAIHFDFAYSGTGDATPADNTISQNISVTGCTFSNVFAGIGAHHDDVPNSLMHKTLKVDHCTFTNIWGEACNAYRINGLTMTNNKINNALCTLNTLKAYNLNINKNTISKNYSHAIWLNNASGVVNNNTITGIGSSVTGIRGRWVTNTTKITNNTITGGENGIYFSDSSNITITGNTAKNAAGNGIGVVNSKSVTVNGNVATNSGSGKDIAVWNCNFSSITGNTVTANPIDNIDYNNDTIVSNNTQYNLNGWKKNSSGQWCYYKKGQIDTSYNDVVYYDNAWRCIQKGVEATSYTGLAKNKFGYWYIKKGKIDFSYNGLCKYNGSWWRIEAGKLNFSYDGFCKWNGVWWCIVDGRYDSTKNNTLYKHSNGTWFYIKQKGTIDFSYTGLVKYGNAWWYVKNGELDMKFTGLGKNKANGTWWCVKKGKVDFGCNTFVQHNGQWWNIKGGQVDFSYTGLKKFGNSWWYVKAGMIDKSVSAPVKYKGTWYAVIKGKVNFTYTGYLSNKSGKYRFKNGKICF